MRNSRAGAFMPMAAADHSIFSSTARLPWIAVIDHRQRHAEKDHQRLGGVADAEPQHDDRHQRGLRHRIDHHQQRIEERRDRAGCGPSSGRSAMATTSASAKPIAMRRSEAAMLSSDSGSPGWPAPARAPRAAGGRPAMPMSARGKFPREQQREAGEQRTATPGHGAEARPIMALASSARVLHQALDVDDIVLIAAVDQQLGAAARSRQVDRRRSP